jgi:lipopolysaccharide export system permease protein
MTVGQAWVGAGRVGMLPFLLALHGGTLALGLLLVTARHNHWSLRALLPRGSAA